MAPSPFIHAGSISQETEKTADQRPEALVSHISLHIHKGPGFDQKLIELASTLIFLKEGHEFSASLLDASIRALSLSKQFSAIHVDSQDQDGAIALFFDLQPAVLIRDIEIDGIYPFFEKDILKVMTVSVGDIFTAETQQRQALLIEEFFKREGFLDPSAGITVDADPESGNVTLHIAVEKGRYWKLDRIIIKEKQNVNHSYLKSKMKIWRTHYLPGTAGRFIEAQVRNDIERLAEHYRSLGFAACAIDASVQRNAPKARVTVDLTVAEGPLYRVRFTGNHAFSDSKLKEDAVFLHEGITSDRIYRKSIKKIKERYRNAGFPDVAVSCDVDDSVEEKTSIRTVTFTVNEGVFSRIEEIRISGNAMVPDDEIRKELVTEGTILKKDTPYIREDVNRDAAAIKVLYHRHGFINAMIRIEVAWGETDAKGRSAAITFFIDEGTRTILTAVTIKGLTVISEAEAVDALNLKVGEPFRPYMLENEKHILSSLVAEKGHPYVAVEHAASISTDQSQAYAEYIIDEGPRAEVGQIFITGNFRTRKALIENELGIQTGDLFSPVRLLQGQRNVRDMDIFSSVRFKAIGLAEKTGLIHLIVDVKEKKPYFVQAGIGYESQSGLYAKAKTGDRNFLGARKNLWMSSTISEIGYRTDLGVTEPRFLGSRVSATLALFQEKKEEFNQDFGVETYGSSLQFSKAWPYGIATELGFRFEQKELFCSDGGSGTGTEGDIGSARSILVTTPAISFDSRDSFIRPRKGMFFKLSFDVSKGIRNSFDDFLKYRFDGKYYISPLPRLTFAFVARAGLIQLYGDSGTVPRDQLFYLGGISDVRGFSENMLRYDSSENPAGGRLSLSGSMEARIDLGGNVELTTFVDTGSVSRTMGNYGSGGFRSSVGAGLRYLTPIGPIGFLYGVKLDPRENERSGRFHFSIGYTF